MTRVTKSDLEALVALLNRSVGAPQETYKAKRDKDGRLVANPETFQLDWSYGGVRLTRNGGSIDISPRGTKGEIDTWIRAYLYGIWYAQDQVKS